MREVRNLLCCSQEFSLAKCILELSRDPPVPPRVFAAYMEKRYAAASPTMCDCYWCSVAQIAAQQRDQKRRAAAVGSAAARGASGLNADGRYVKRRE